MGMYGSFLSMVYKNIRSFWKKDEKSDVEKFTISDASSVACLENELDELKSEGKKIMRKDEKDMNKVYNLETKGATSTVSFRAVTKQSVKDSVGTCTLLSKRERGIARDQMELLKTKFGAKFASTEEEVYFLELLAMRALGPPTWTDDLEDLFRAQLSVNIDGLTADKLATALDMLQEGIIAGHPLDESILNKSRSKASAALEKLLAGKGISIDDADSRSKAVSEMMRFAEDPPYWRVDDQDYFDAMLARLARDQEIIDPSVDLNADLANSQGAGNGDGTDGSDGTNGKLGNGGDDGSQGLREIKGASVELPGGFKGKSTRQPDIHNNGGDDGSQGWREIKGVSVELPGGFKGKSTRQPGGGDGSRAYNATKENADAAKRVEYARRDLLNHSERDDIHNEAVDVSHVKSKIDTGNRRRARKSKKDKQKKHHSSRPVKSVSPTQGGQLLEIKGSVSVSPGLANQTLNLKTGEMDEKGAMKQQAMKEMQVELETVELSYHRMQKKASGPKRSKNGRGHTKQGRGMQAAVNLGGPDQGKMQVLMLPPVRRAPPDRRIRTHRAPPKGMLMPVF